MDVRYKVQGAGGKKFYNDIIWDFDVETLRTGKIPLLWRSGFFPKEKRRGGF